MSEQTKRACKQVGDVTHHYTANDGDTNCECGSISTADAVALFTPPPEPPTLLSMDEEIDALKEFAAKMQRMSPNGRRAAICWLADFYLGIKWWGR